MFEVLNRAEVPSAALAELDKGHLKVLAYASQGTGVVSGGLIAPGAGRTINVSAIDARRASNVISAVAVTNLAIAAPDATYARWDLVIVTEGNVIEVTTGTAAQQPQLPAVPENVVVLGAVYVTPLDTGSIPAAQIQSLQVPVLDMPRFDGQILQRNPMARMVMYGHSYAFGYGASDPDRDVITHLAAMMALREVPRTVNGAQIVRNQQGTAGDGGYAHILQNEIRLSRGNTTLAAQATAGATTLTLTAASTFVYGDVIHVGIGAAGATGGETKYVVAGMGTTTLTIDSPLARTHLNGEPVFATASSYLNPTPLYLYWYGANDVGQFPATSAAAAIQSLFTDAFRLGIARFRCAEIFENDNSSCLYAGSWAGAVAVTHSNSGATLRQASAAGATVTIIVPDNFKGGAVVLGWVGGNTGSPTSPVITYTVDGVAAGTQTVYNAAASAFRGLVKRFTGLSPGRHTIVAEVTTIGNLALYFDWWGIEAEQPSLVLVPGPNRPYSYVLWSAKPNKNTTTTVTGTHGSGTTSWTVGSTAGMLVGATVTFEEGLGNVETLEVATVTDATHFTTTTASALSHAGGSAVVYGWQDADVAKLDTIMRAVCAEFDERVLYVPIEQIIAKNQAYFWLDGAHFNDAGNVVLVKEFYEQLMKAPGVSPDLLAYSAIPVAPLPSEVIFIAGASVTWGSMPAAETELGSLTSLRAWADTRRCAEYRFSVGVATAGFAGARLFLQYSLDGGTTWTHLGRDYAFSKTSTASRNAASVLIDAATTTGPVNTGWLDLPPECMAESILFRLMGVGGNGTVSPIFRIAKIQFR